MKIILVGKPIAKMRARHAYRNGFVVTYDPQSEAKESVKTRFSQELQKLLDSDIKNVCVEAGEITRANAYEVYWDFYLPLNESDTISVRNSKLWGFELPTCKPDYDNLEKFYLDCANSILWPDDRMIISAHANKHYSETPRMEVTIMSKKELKLPEKAEKVIKVFSPDQFREFLEDVRKLMALDPACVDAFEGAAREVWLTSAASLVSKFALKHAATLKKVQKAGDLASDIQNRDENLACLEEELASLHE